jgi:hypothetical protein
MQRYRFYYGAVLTDEHGEGCKHEDANEEKLWELWVGSGRQSFHPADHPQREFLTAGLEKTWEVRAYGHDDAMTKYHAHMGWKPYACLKDQESDDSASD